MIQFFYYSIVRCICAIFYAILSGESFIISFKCTSVLIYLALDPKYSAYSVSYVFYVSWLMQQMIAVCDQPSKAFYKIRVSFESRKFMYKLFLLEILLRLLNLQITFERARSDLLILPPSLSLTPYDLVLEAPSEPARSTKLIQLARMTEVPVWVFLSVICKNTLKIVCERELFLFTLVSANTLSYSPF